MRVLLHAIGWLSVSVTALSCTDARAQAELKTERVSVDGGHVDYVVSGPEDAAPVLLLHGAMLGTALLRVQQAPALEGHRVIRMHQRGFVGSSEAAPGMSGVSDAIALLDALGVERVHVVGHSGGAVLALQIAAQVADRVRALVLIDPAPMPNLAAPETMARAERALAAMGAGLESDGAHGALREFSSVVFGENWREFFDAIPGGYEQALADLNRFQPGSGAPPLERSQLSRIDRPTLVLWGEESWLAEHAITLSSVLPNAEGNLIADTDHALITQRPNAVAAAIADFITRQP